jgi:hypothetical protein
MRRVGTGVSLQAYYDEGGTTSSKDFARLEKTTNRKLSIMRDQSTRSNETKRSEKPNRSAELRPLASPRFRQPGGDGD